MPNSIFLENIFYFKILQRIVNEKVPQKVKKMPPSNLDKDNKLTFECFPHDSGDLNSKLVWYSGHGDLFDHQIVCYSDARCLVQMLRTLLQHPLPLQCSTYIVRAKVVLSKKFNF